MNIVPSNHNSNVELKENQGIVLDKLMARFAAIANGLHTGQKVFSLVGDRGSGKSTILKKLCSLLRSDFQFRSTSLIDSARVVNEELMVTCINNVWDSFQDILGNEDCSSSAFSLTINQKTNLENLKRESIQLSQMSEGLIRDLSREMAMSPEQYLYKISELDEKTPRLSKTFGQLVEGLLELHRRKNQPRADVLVIILDDLDLADPVRLKNWALFLTLNQVNIPVYWILSYSHHRMVTILSSRKISDNELDLETGEALLSKIVPFHQQFVLPSWEPDDRLSFFPFSHELPFGFNCNEYNNDPLEDNKGVVIQSEKSRHFTIKSLLKNVGFIEFLLLLPLNPRGLLHLYHRLYELKVDIDKINHQCTDVANPLKPGRSHTLISFFCDANKVYELKKHLKNTWANRIVLDFKWKDNEQISSYIWAAIVKEANQNDTLRGIPIPEALHSLVDNNMPTIHLEVLSNLGLKEKVITPYRLLQEMPFTKSRLEACFSELNVERHFVKMFESQPVKYCWTLPWGSWEYQEAESVWRYRLSPDLFFQVLFKYRDFKPKNDFKPEFFSRDKLDPCLTAMAKKLLAFSVENSLPYLPANLRGILLFVDSLQKAPWQELGNIQNFWGPITMAQCAASFLLSAVAFTIWRDETIIERIKPDSSTRQPILYFPDEPFSELKRLDETEIDLAYDRLLGNLHWLCENKPSESFQRKYLKHAFSESEPKLTEEEYQIIELPYQELETMARDELKRFLKLLLRHPAVTDLRLPEESS